MAWLGAPRVGRIYQCQNSRDLDTNKDYDTGGNASVPFFRKLDMRPDGLHHTKMVSAMFLTAIQRRHGLYLSVIAPTLVEKAAAGEHVTVGEYKGDFLANSNKGDRTSKHSGVLRAAQNAIRARSVGSIILGDKEKRSRAPHPCCHKAQCAATKHH